MVERGSDLQRSDTIRRQPILRGNKGRMHSDRQNQRFSTPRAVFTLLPPRCKFESSLPHLRDQPRDERNPTGSTHRNEQRANNRINRKRCEHPTIQVSKLSNDFGIPLANTQQIVADSVPDVCVAEPFGKFVSPIAPGAKCYFVKQSILAPP
jgi:hypothetical protein